MTELPEPSAWYRDEPMLMAELRKVRDGDVPTPSIAGYSELREIGRGGQGMVYRARQQSTGQDVAIKVLRDEQPDAEHRARFLREVELVASLAHPGIVKVFDSGSTQDGRLYLAMELIEGVPFDEFASSRSVEQTLELTADVAMAVQHAHQRGVIHRDLKPANVRVDAHGCPRVLDFGLAKPLVGATATVLVSRTGLFLGSLPWASPEQLGGDASIIDARSDVYALGVMLYTALCNTAPYETSGGIRETVENVTSARPAPPHRNGRPLPADLAAIVLHALEKEPSRRYQNASELALDLHRFLAHQPVSAQNPSAGYLLRTWVRRHRGLSVALSLMLVGALSATVALWLLYGRSQQSAAEARASADKFAAVNEYLLGAILTTPGDGNRSVKDAVRKAAAGVDEHSGFANPLFKAEAYNAVAYWLSSIGDKQAAWQHHEKAMRLRAPRIDAQHPDMTPHYTTLAYFRQLHEDHAGTIELMELALDNLTREGDASPSTLAWIHRVVAQAHLALGDFDGASVSIERSLAIEKRIRAPGERQLEEGLKVQADIRKRRHAGG